jgi:hypothetical protein
MYFMSGLTINRYNSITLFCNYLTYNINKSDYQYIKTDMCLYYVKKMYFCYTYVPCIILT